MSEKKTCEYPPCEELLRTGKHYHSTRCSALDRERKKRLAKSGKITRADVAPRHVRELIPDGVQTLMTEHLGDGSYEVLSEMARTMLEEATPAPPLQGKTEGDYTWSYYLAGEDRRPNDALDYDIIEEMMKSGPVVFVLEMKLAALMSVWRNERSWKVISPDKELTDVVTANLREILPLTALNFLRPALAYGASFHELVWEMKSPYQLGLTNSRASGKRWAVAKVPNSCNPTSIDRIERTGDGSFNGFVQIPRHHYTTQPEISVPVDQALVIPYKMQYRNLWGESYLKPMYPVWFWYEVALRSWVRYLERMGTPVTVAYAPSRAKIRKPGSTTLTDAMTWGLAIAGNVAKSNAAVMPSDVDPTTNQPLWRLEYLTAEDRGSIFKDALEFLARMLVQAGMSADMAFTKGSGDTGSRNLWEGHNAVTQLHNELILIEHLVAINKWWMPHFSVYNRGINGPPIHLETEGLDPSERENLFKIAGLAGNSASFQDALMMVDWRTLYELNNIPALTEEELQKVKDKLQEEALQKQKEFVEVQAKAAEAKKDEGGFGQKNGKQAGPAGKPPATAAKEAKAEADKLEQVGHMMVDGQYSPLLMTDDQMQRLLQIRQSGGDVILKTEVEEEDPFDEDRIELFNPFHDPATGRFASKRGGGKAGGAESKTGLKKGKKRKAGEAGGAGAKPGSFLSTTGKILGLVGLGAVALAVVGAASGGGDLDAYEEMKEERLAEAETEMEALTENWPDYADEAEAFNVAKNALTKAGVQIEPDIKMAVDDSKVPSGAAGLYDSETNTFYMRSDMAADLRDGDPAAVKTLLHEMAHSAQEADTESGWGTWRGGTLVQDDENEKRFRDYFEGQNDLVTGIAASDEYGMPMDNKTAARLHDEKERVEADIKFAQSGSAIMGRQVGSTDLGYDNQAAAYAGIVTAYGRKTGKNATEVLYEAHATGFDQATHYDILLDLLPAQMSGFDEGYYPPYQVVMGWIKDEYGIDSYDAYQDLLEGAAQ